MALGRVLAHRVLGGVTLGNQLAAKLIARNDDSRHRRRVVTAAVALDLLALGVFKYYSFFVQSLSDALDRVGLGLPLPLVTIADAGSLVRARRRARSSTGSTSAKPSWMRTSLSGPSGLRPGLRL